jgi:hypothetical protein
MRMLTLVLHMNQTQHGRVDFHNLTCYKREKSSEPAEICPIKNFVPNAVISVLTYYASLVRFGKNKDVHVVLDNYTEEESAAMQRKKQNCYKFRLTKIFCCKSTHVSTSSFVMFLNYHILILFFMKVYVRSKVSY